MMTKRITTVLFDLDGVLVDAAEWHYEAFNRALQLFGFTISRYEHLSAYNGLPTRKKLEMLTVEKGLPVALHSVINRLKQSYTRDEITTRCRPAFEKEYMLRRLKDEGYRIGVCSNAAQDSVALMLRQAGLEDYLDLVLSNGDVQKPKPDPCIYTHALARLTCAADQVVGVEDAPYGVQAARAAGLHVFEVAGVQDVDYFAIRGFIDAIERGNGAR